MESSTWKRAIILADMNAFFASVEQRDNPELQSRPIGITNGQTGTCIITCSYEARAYGIKTGMRLREARLLCPDLIQIPSRPHRYAEVSSSIMASLQNITPDIEVFSVDEAFLDVTACQRLSGTPERIARRVKHTIFEASGVLCSVGVSGDKTTAKWAAKLKKPDGLTVVPPWEAEERLRDVPVTDLCGINKGIGGFLAGYGVYRCGDMRKIPISVLGRRFGNPGRRIWYMAQGADPAPIETNVAAPKSIGHGKVIPPNTRDRCTLETYFLHMAEKVAARLRRHDLQAQRFTISFRTNEGWFGGKVILPRPISDGGRIMSLCRDVLAQHWDGKGINQVQITATDPKDKDFQLELFEEPDRIQASPANEVMDQINRRFGDFSLAPARLVNRSEMPDVIAPSWKPFGHRETILER